MYKLLYELPNDLRLRILGQEEILEISEYSLAPSLPPALNIWEYCLKQLELSMESTTILDVVKLS